MCGWGYGAQPAYVNCADVKIVSKSVALPLANFVAPDYQALYASLDGTAATTGPTTLFPPIVTNPTDSTNTSSSTTDTPPTTPDRLVIGPVIPPILPVAPVVPAVIGGGLSGTGAIIAAETAAAAGGTGALLGTGASAAAGAGLLGGLGGFGGLLFPGLMVLGAMSGMSGMFGRRSSGPVIPVVLPDDNLVGPSPFIGSAPGPIWPGGNFPLATYGRPIFIPDRSRSISVSESVSVNYRQPYNRNTQYNSYRNYNG